MRSPSECARLRAVRCARKVCIYEVSTARNFVETVKRRRFLFPRGAFHRVAGSLRRVWLGPKRRWQQCAGMRPAALWQVTHERQESLQHIADVYFNVEITSKRSNMAMNIEPTKKCVVITTDTVHIGVNTT